MKRLLITLLILASLLTIGFTYRAQPVIFEYKIEKDADEKRLNQLGAEGWELVTLDRGTGALSRSMFVLKRVKP